MLVFSGLLIFYGHGKCCNTALEYQYVDIVWLRLKFSGKGHLWIIDLGMWTLRCVYAIMIITIITTMVIIILLLVTVMIMV